MTLLAQNLDKQPGPKRHHLLSRIAGATLLLGIGAAHDATAAEPPPAESQPSPPSAASSSAEAAVSAAASDDAGALSARAAASDSGRLLLAGKFGGIASLNGLSPFPTFGIEAGYVFGGTGGRIAALLAAEYTAPSASGSHTEAFSPERVPGGGSYDWELRQKELVLQPTFMYRLPGLVERVTPYAGVGLRIYLLESVARGDAGGERILDSVERSTKFGAGMPLGAELELGPGGLFTELLVQWGPLKHTTTGDTHLGGASLFVGYRAAL